MRPYHFCRLLFCVLFYDKQMRPQVKTVTRLPYPFLLNISICFETFSDCADVVSIRTSMYPRKKILTLKMALNLNLRVSARAHAQLSFMHTCASHVEEITDKFLHIHLIAETLS